MKNRRDIFSFITYRKDKLDFYSNRSYFITNNSILWLKEESTNIYLMGIDFFTLYDSGEITNLSTRPSGSIIDANKVLIRIETSKPGCCGGLTMKTLTIPWQVEILEKNKNLSENFSLVSKDPFNSGWIYKIKAKIRQNDISNQSSILNGVFVSSSKPDLIKKEIRNFLRKNKVISYGDY